MKKQRHEIGTIVAWANDGEEAYFDTIQEAYEDLIERDYDVSLDDFTKTLGTCDEIASGVTYFRYGIDEEATKGYDDACEEADRYAAEKEE